MSCCRNIGREKERRKGKYEMREKTENEIRDTQRVKKEMTGQRE
jgi:hypothetical protein